jgi:hypothetical protein
VRGGLPSSSRRLGLAFLGALAVLVAIDSALPQGFVRANGILDQGLLHGFSDCDPETFARLGHTASSIDVPGFPALGRVSVRMELLRPRDLRVVEDPEASLSGSTLSASVRADASGRLTLHFQDPAGKRRGIFDLVRLTLRGSPGLGPLGRLGALAALLLLLGVYSAWATEGRSPVMVFVLGAVVIDLAFLAFRFYLVSLLPGLLGLFAVGLVFAVVLDRAGVPRRHGRLVLPLLLFRLGLVLLPSFPVIDLEFHAHNVERFRNGEVLKSRAPGAERGEALPVPYPPALYAVLAALPAGSEEILLRGVMGLLEGTAPLLVFLALRAGGADAEVAGWGAAIHAALPEGILVLGKGIAANILGSWVTLLFAWAYLQGAGVVLLGALLSLVFLSHFGQTLCVLCLLLVLLVPREGRGRLLAAAGGAALLSFAVYYREVLGLAAGGLSILGGHAQGAPGAFFRVRVIRILKTVQDLALKFGGGSLALLVAGAALPARLGQLLKAWFAVGLGLGLVALLTPIPLRFEYFLLAPVAMRGAYGAVAWEAAGRGRVASRLVTLCLIVEVAIGVFLVFQRFDLISVIQESDRWEFPFLWCGRVQG